MPTGSEPADGVERTLHEQVPGAHVCAGFDLLDFLGHLFQFLGLPFHLVIRFEFQVFHLDRAVRQTRTVMFRLISFKTSRTLQTQINSAAGSQAFASEVGQGGAARAGLAGLKRSAGSIDVHTATVTWSNQRFVGSSARSRWTPENPREHGRDLGDTRITPSDLRAPRTRRERATVRCGAIGQLRGGEGLQAKVRPRLPPLLRLQAVHQLAQHRHVVLQRNCAPTHQAGDASAPCTLSTQTRAQCGVHRSASLLGPVCSNSLSASASKSMHPMQSMRLKSVTCARPPRTYRLWAHPPVARWNSWSLLVVVVPHTPNTQRMRPRPASCPSKAPNFPSQTFDSTRFLFQPSPPSREWVAQERLVWPFPYTYIYTSAKSWRV